MKNLLCLLFSAVLVSTVLVGFAKRPAATVTPGPMEEEIVSSTPSYEDVTGYEDGAMSSSAVVAEEDKKKEDTGYKSDTNSSSDVEDKTGFEALTGEPVAEMEQISFGFDQFTLTAEAHKVLAANVKYMKANPALNVLIEGHCDERGSDEYNLALGERRANAAKSYMVVLGIAPSRLRTISLGEEMPLEVAHNESAWAKNRRGEFKPIR